MRAKFMMATAALVVVGVAGLTWTCSRDVHAADHREAPGTLADDTGDLADVYAWHDQAANTLTAVITYGGDTAALPVYDLNVLYELHIDNDGDNLADISVDVRFGSNNFSEVGVQVLNLPGAGGAIVGNVEEVLSGNTGGLVFAGYRDDPFFFDGTGFGDTLATGTLSFDSTRDTFAGQNIMAIVLEMPLSAAMGTGATLNIWATSGRIQQ